MTRERMPNPDTEWPHETMAAQLENAEWLAEYWQTYDSVLAANRAGYHKPRNNLHDDALLGCAYDAGFRDALADLEYEAAQP